MFECYAVLQVAASSAAEPASLAAAATYESANRQMTVTSQVSGFPASQGTRDRPSGRFPSDQKTKWIFGAWNASKDHSPGDQIIQGVVPGQSTRSFLTNKAMQSLRINQGPTMSGRLGTRHSSNTTLQIWMLCDVDTGEPLTSSNAASNHVNDRPTSQRRAVCQLCFLQSLTAADDDFLDFWHGHIFSSTFSFSNPYRRRSRFA